MWQVSERIFIELLITIDTTILLAQLSIRPCAQYYNEPTGIGFVVRPTISLHRAKYCNSITNPKELNCEIHGLC